MWEFGSLGVAPTNSPEGEFRSVDNTTKHIILVTSHLSLLT